MNPGTRLKKYVATQLLKVIDKNSIRVSPSAKESLTLLPSSTFIQTNTPVWRNLSQLIYLLDCYYQNPIVQPIINMKADAWSNMQIQVRDLKTKEKVDLEDYDADGGKLYELLSQPNPLQTKSEWLKQLKVNFEVFGNGYIYGLVPTGWEDKFSYLDITVLNNLPPYCIAPVLTGNWLTATTKEDIVSKYVLNNFNNSKKDLHSNTVMHFNNVNIRFDQEFTVGKSKLVGLERPISNIDAAYEARNGLIVNRGPQGIFVSASKDEAMGTIPMTDAEIERTQKAISRYGLMDDQYRNVISPNPLSYIQTGVNTKELLLFEEVSHSAMPICHAFGVPHDLLPNYIKTGSLGSDNDTLEKRLYTSTIIPETNDFMVILNRFFNTKELGIELIGSYDHLPILQANKKEEAETVDKRSQTAERSFRSGAITYNTYLERIGEEHDPTIGNLRIWDLTDVQLATINKQQINQNTNGNN